MSEPNQDPPDFFDDEGLPSPEAVARLQTAVAAQATVRELGGDPAALEALAMLRSEVVEGVTVFANPAATYCTMRVIRDFFKGDPQPEAEEGLPMNQIVAMVYAFAEPATSYLMARRGEEVYFTAAFAWTARHFRDASASHRLGRVAGWCVEVISILSELNPRMPVESLTKPTARQAPATPPAPTPDSSQP